MKAHEKQIQQQEEDACSASRGAIVRLLGDDRQLSAVESGGALRLIAAQPGTPHLSVLHRFRDPDEAAATLQLRTGDASALDWYARNGRIRSGSREWMTQAAYHGWKADMLAGKLTLMAAGDGTDVTELSAQARADRVAAGQVESDGVVLRDGNLAGAGDWIVTRLNDRRLAVHGGRDWVKNGDAWHVERRLADGSLAVRHTGHGGRVTLPAGYVRTQVQLLYATTAHRAQGVTTDTAHPLITPGMTREILYVLASRARENTTFYVATHDLPFDDDAHVNQARTDPRSYAAREVLLNILATEGAALSATETIATAQEEAGSLATLVPRYLHAAHQHAEGRYRDAAITVFGQDGGRDLIADPAWGAVVRRLFDAENTGWEPARLLEIVKNRRELDSAESVAEVLAWRIDAHLADTPEPPRQNQPYETAAEASSRLAAVAATTLAPRLDERARKETAWPALIAALRQAENAGHDATALLASAARSRDLRTARSISEVLAWRIGRHVATQPDLAPVSPSPSAADKGLLPWVPSPPQAPSTDESASLAGYLNDAAALITDRIGKLADAAIRERPAWMSMLGQQPADPERRGQWLHHIAVVAAYRDQYQITSDDPRQVIGPYRERGHAGHGAYWHAAESVLAARQLTGLDPAANHPQNPGLIRAQIAADIYRALPEDESAVISTDMASRLGIRWFGDPDIPDEHAAVHPAYQAHLTAILIEHGYLAGRTPIAGHSRHMPDQEPVEAAVVRRGRHPRRVRTAEQAASQSATQRKDNSHRSAQQAGEPPRMRVHEAPAPRHSP